MALLACDGGTDTASSGDPTRDAESDAASDGPQLEEDAGADAEASTEKDGESDAAEDGADVVVPELTWGACDTSDWPDGYPYPSPGVECTRIEAPFDYAEPGGERFDLAVARHPARNDPGKEAVFIIVGGPGGTAISQSGSVSPQLPDLRDRFDLVYVDQRGTGASGRLDCANGLYTVSDVKDCGAEHGDKDLNHYLTVDAAHDLDFVRQRLGYQQISMIAISYGVRVALEYTRQHESSVQAALLLGAIAPDTDWIGEGATFFTRAMDRLIEECAGSQDCLAVSPSLESDLWERREALRLNPRPIHIEGYGAYQEDEGFFLDLLVSMVSDSRTRFRIPSAIHQAVAGDNAPWNQLCSELIGGTVTDASSTSSLSKSLYLPLPRPGAAPALGDFVANGVYMTIFCAEYLPNSPGVDALWDITEQQPWPMEAFATYASGCSAWKVEPLAASLRTAVASDVPALVVGGEHDINTIPEWGEHVASTLSNGTFLSVPHATHMTIWGSCLNRIYMDYLLSTGDMSAVDTSCVNSLPHPGW
jgi:pimeloyl-ACP methyl ester carboxylesterase